MLSHWFTLAQHLYVSLYNAKLQTPKIQLQKKDLWIAKTLWCAKETEISKSHIYTHQLHTHTLSQTCMHNSRKTCRWNIWKQNELQNKSKFLSNKINVFSDFKMFPMSLVLFNTNCMTELALWQEHKCWL